MASTWYVKFSPEKTIFMIEYPQLVFGGIVDSFKHLGITLQNDLLWEKQSDNILNNSNKKPNILFALI